MRTITLKTAKAIAADWHGGQWSALYAFASGGLLNTAQEPLCLAEVLENLNENGVSKRQTKRLQMLKTYFESKVPKDIEQ
ncbi:hypothetical protein CKK33_16820 [Mucilaginibacter sp. MD40]|uniref:hypothetical protein n=1 Tax=Mucilaginibacter sp. MD40 TaxID=2029590 RepID=UPI000BACB5EA|nr:hypothetical protein [Mucilaginibacter sp. MD40]PAW95066.1 hypothetical protein CKK33_16820 [Mucilaginibacter sp. MD40]